MNSVQPGVQNMGMNIFVLERELLISLIDEAYLKGQSYFERDVWHLRPDSFICRGIVMMAM